MNAKRAGSRPRRALPGRYHFSARERVAFERLTQAEVTAAHRLWGAQARFEWPALAGGSTEVIGVVAADGTVVAMCAVTYPVRREKPTATAFRLDFVEVAPTQRGQQLWGPVTLAGLAAIARTAGCSELILLALPEREQWYRRMGATDAPGLHGEPGLVPLRFDAAALEALARKLDGIQEKAED